MDVNTIVDRKSKYYSYVASTWGKQWAEQCRTMALIANLNKGEMISRKADSRDKYGFFFPEIDSIALNLAKEIENKWNNDNFKKSVTMPAGANLGKVATPELNGLTAMKAAQDVAAAEDLKKEKIDSNTVS